MNVSQYQKPSAIQVSTEGCPLASSATSYIALVNLRKASQSHSSLTRTWIRNDPSSASNSRLRISRGDMGNDPIIVTGLVVRRSVRPTLDASSWLDQLERDFRETAEPEFLVGIDS